MAILDEIYRSFDQVDDNVSIGGFLAASDSRLVERERFTHILKLFEDASYPGGYHRHQDVVYLVIPAEDSSEYELDKHFAECLQFIQKCIRERGKILVHCHAGVSRSSTIVLLHLMINNGMTLEAAHSYLKRIRPVINPNKGFRKLLVDIDRRARRFRSEGKAPHRPDLRVSESCGPACASLCTCGPSCRCGVPASEDSNTIVKCDCPGCPCR